MTAYRDAQDLERYVGGIFVHALADPELGPRLVGTGVRLKVVVTEPDGVLILDLPNRDVRLGAPDDPADTTMRMRSETANRFWQGKVNLPVAMARGQVKVDGAIGALLKLVPSTGRLYPAYVDLVTRDGRHDLLAD